MATAGEAIVSVGMAEEAITAEAGASPIADRSGGGSIARRSRAPENRGNATLAARVQVQGMRPSMPLRRGAAPPRLPRRASAPRRAAVNLTMAATLIIGGRGIGSCAANQLSRVHSGRKIHLKFDLAMEVNYESRNRVRFNPT